MKNVEHLIQMVQRFLIVCRLSNDSCNFRWI